MQYRRMVVLANSIKRGGRCVAGRMTDAAPGVNAWLRPISDIGHGELMPEHLHVEDRRPIVPLDTLMCRSFATAWTSAIRRTGCSRKSLGAAPGGWNRPICRASKSSPPDLWLEDRRHTDRISCDYHKRRQRFQSLHLVRPEQLRLRLWSEPNEEKGHVQKKTRAVFRYERVEYALSLTDPLITMRHRIVHPSVGAARVETPFPFGDRCLLCVSLTPTFNDYHYKVVATVLELP